MKTPTYPKDVAEEYFCAPIQQENMTRIPCIMSVRTFSVKPIVIIRTVYHPMPGVHVGELEDWPDA
jgi:hypothetical protein